VSAVSVTLSEWAELLPHENSVTRGLTFADDAAARRMATTLAKTGKLEIQELASGLAIRSTSYVGSVGIGPVRVTVRPKIAGLPLVVLLRYAYGLRNLHLHEHVRLDASSRSFQDLLIAQLAAEAGELVARGLYRTYQARSDCLSSPRGKISFQEIARTGGLWGSTLPCWHYPRLEDCLPNQMLVAGVRLAASMTSDLELRARLRRIAACTDNVATVDLAHYVFARLERETGRLTRAYKPAFQLIRILYHNLGTEFERSAHGVSVPGFLFDMNRFFQALVGRFLRENLDGFRLREEYRLHGMFAYVPGLNPKKKSAPVPRPDYVILDETGRVMAILDAKYRDLWENSLPRDMLYQLALYALSQRGVTKAIILYPTTESGAGDAAIEVREPVSGGSRAQVVLRPVIINHLAEVLAEPDSVLVARQRRELARKLVFGDRDASVTGVHRF